MQIVLLGSESRLEFRALDLALSILDLGFGILAWGFGFFECKCSVFKMVMHGVESNWCLPRSPSRLNRQP